MEFAVWGGVLFGTGIVLPFIWAFFLEFRRRREPLRFRGEGTGLEVELSIGRSAAYGGQPIITSTIELRIDDATNIVKFPKRPAEAGISVQYDRMLHLLDLLIRKQMNRSLR